MKKLALILVPCIIGSLVLTAGGIVLGIGIGQAYNHADVRLIEETFKLEEEFENFNINLDTSDLEFKVGETDEKKVVVRHVKNVSHEVSVKDNSLIIKETDVSKWYEHIFNFKNNQKVTIYLPSQAFDKINIDTDTGDVVIPNLYSFNTMDVKLDTGNFYSRAWVNESIKVESSTGDQYLAGINTKEVNLKASTGHINLKDMNVENTVTLKASTGEMSIFNLNAKNLDMDTDTGDKAIINSLVSEHIEIKASTGDVFINDSDADTLNIQTSTGDVRGVLLTGKTFQATSSTGRVNVPATTGGLCSIKTSTGDIYMQVKA